MTTPAEHPSIVEEEQLHVSKDASALKGEKALLELLLDMVCHANLLDYYFISSPPHDS